MSSKRNVQNGTRKSAQLDQSKKTERAKSNTMSLSMDSSTMVQRIPAEPRGGNRMPARLLCFW
jgi:hypothetical protein